MCEQCGFVHWFVRTPHVASSPEDTTLADEIETLRRRLEAEFEASAEPEPAHTR